MVPIILYWHSGWSNNSRDQPCKWCDWWPEEWCVGIIWYFSSGYSYLYSYSCDYYKIILTNRDEPQSNKNKLQSFEKLNCPLHNHPPSFLPSLLCSVISSCTPLLLSLNSLSSPLSPFLPLNSIHFSIPSSVCSPSLFFPPSFPPSLPLQAVTALHKVTRWL